MKTSISNVSPALNKIDPATSCAVPRNANATRTPTNGAAAAMTRSVMFVMDGWVIGAVCTRSARPASSSPRSRRVAVSSPHAHAAADKNIPRRQTVKPPGVARSNGVP